MNWQAILTHDQVKQLVSLLYIIIFTNRNIHTDYYYLCLNFTLLGSKEGSENLNMSHNGEKSTDFSVSFNIMLEKDEDFSLSFRD